MVDWNLLILEALIFFVIFLVVEAIIVACIWWEPFSCTVTSILNGAAHLALTITAWVVTIIAPILTEAGRELAMAVTAIVVAKVLEQFVSLMTMIAV
ncbi:hypothetical protein CUJ83_04925 [Methanocella sp. CWC-04]|uniref:Uncharacterized protein n=1 Tax=Methanooceanicella nereidis TaxID=2052831 RepID=A0AAP2W6P8_9EURY|nr:hypothetical protein [Methanocella sp. CWC-04]MCD1294341.1 hypothetical protein [Methanocella sp. CWC-04]